MKKKASNSFYAPKHRGGVIGGAGYNFQDAYIVSHLPQWLAQPDFHSYIKEGLEDVDVLFGEEENLRNVWHYQLKDHQVSVSEFKKILSHYEMVEVSVKEPWSDSWKSRRRTKIKGCNGVIVLISKNLKKADGAIWEIKCAKEEQIPILGVYMKGCGLLDTPDELNGIKKIAWTWTGIAEFVNGL
jgi:hypothetical protein